MGLGSSITEIRSFLHELQCVNRNLQNLLHVGVKLTFDVDQEEVAHTEAKDSEPTIVLWVVAFNTEEAFTIENQDFFRVFKLSFEKHRVETFSASAGTDVELCASQEVEQRRFTR